MISVLFDHVRLRPSQQIGMHTQPTWELSYVISGKGRRTVGTQQEDFEAGEVVLLPPNMPHVWEFQEENGKKKTENITVMFSSSLIHHMALLPEFDYLGKWLSEQNHAVRFEGHIRNLLIERLMEMEAAANDERLLILFKILLLISKDSEKITIGSFPRSPHEKRLHLVETFVRCNYQREITLDDISFHVSMNRSAFCSWFKEVKDMSFITYLNDFRIQMACYLLSKQDAQISQIAYECGFNNLSHFTKTFHKIKGCSPREYRERLE